MDIFKKIEPEVCRKDQIISHTAFVYSEMLAGEEIRKDSLPFNYLLFVLNGDLEVNCNEFESRHFQTNEMVLIKRSSIVCVKATVDTTLCMMYFDAFLSSCDRHFYQTLLPEREYQIYDFQPITIPPPVRMFLDQLQFYQQHKINCMEFHILKHRELFLLLRNLLSRNEIIKLLMPLLGQSVDFRNKILQSYAKMEYGGYGQVDKLSEIMGMGRKNLDLLFRQEFGMSPAKWMIQEKAKQIRAYLAMPGVTIADAIERFHFASSSHFTHFCNRYLNISPKNLQKSSSTPDEITTTM